MTNRLSMLPPSNGEFMSSFTAPAMPNFRKRMSVMPKPLDAKRIPRSPLEPEKLAKLANALGISAPLPASKSPSPSPGLRRSDSSPRPSSTKSTPQSGSATPGSARQQQQGPSSRYLIHVVPPKHFPHPSKKEHPEDFATFRRGCVIPLYASLQAQVAAIAREYQLPTGHGIVLYLVNETGRGRKGKVALGKGPRVGDDVWKWLWTKVGEEVPVGDGSGIGLGISTARTSPADRPSLLRRSVSATQLGIRKTPDFLKNYPPTPPASSGSTSGAQPEDTKEEELQSSLPNPSVTVMDCSVNGLDTGLLPGLGSPSVMPVLAKIEFDIDRRVGTWYETWARSRKSIARHKRKVAQGKLKLRMTIQDRKGLVRPPSPISSSSSSESEDEEEPEPEYSRLDGDADVPTARASSVPGPGDPLSDVFGTDGDAWSDVQATRPGGGSNGELALDGASLSANPNGETPEEGGVSDEEVIALWNKQGKPQLNGSSTKKQIPPPLNLAEREGSVEASLETPSPSYSGAKITNLPYLKAEPEKRLGKIYDDVELDLASDFDFEQHRERQLQVREELDKLERNLAQFSPRALTSLDLNVDSSPSSIHHHSAPPSKTRFSNRVDSLHDSVGSIQMPHSAREAGETFRKTMSPTQYRQPNLVGNSSPDSFKAADGAGSWPSVPYAVLSSNQSESDPQSPTSSSMVRQSRHINNMSSSSPPRVMLNGRATPSRNNSSISSMLSNGSVSAVVRDSPSESAMRSNMYGQESSYYAENPPMLQSSITRRMDSVDSPVLPLSPDPFGRFPSNDTEPMNIPMSRGSSIAKSHLSPSSRFSVDSVGEDEATPKAKGNMVSMRSIRKLWRKSNKASVSSTAPMPSIQSRPPSSVFPLNTDANASKTPSPATPTAAKGPQKTRNSRDEGLDPFYFDQDPKYPSARRNTPSPSPQSAFQFPPQSSAASSRSATPSSHSPSIPQPSTPNPAMGMEKVRSVRKSFVSKWKNGSDGGNSLGGGGSSTDSITGMDTTRKRRPSMLDVTGLMRGSVSSQASSAGGSSIGQSPSMPELPAIFRNPEMQSPSSPQHPGSPSTMSSHTRLTSRGSMSTLLTMASNIDAERSAGPGRRKPQQQASTDSSVSTQEPDIPTPVSAVAPLSFHKNKGTPQSAVFDSMGEPGVIGKGGPGVAGEIRMGSVDTLGSEGLRESGSFDESQFEMVNPHPR